MPIRPYNPTDEDDPYSKAGAGTDAISADPNDAPESPSSSPKPYEPPKTVASPKTAPEEAPPVRTFAQMEAEGQARPPAPESGPAVSGLLTGDLPSEYAPPSISSGRLAPPMGEGYPVEQMIGGIGGGSPPGPDDNTRGITGPGGPQPWGEGYPGGLDPTRGGEATGGAGGPQPMGEGYPGDHGSMVGGGGKSLPSSVDSILPLLTGKATGNGQSDLERATTAKTMAQLNGSSPYDSNEVRNEYDWLAGNIDDQFANDVRHTDDAFAQRGLYGSAGKDFHSGRLADLNVGKRSAKEALGRDLAEKYATTKGQYDANAINQGQSGVNAQNANQQNWLHSLMGYGNDAYNHDLETAEFQQHQNESEQDYLLRLLQMGYGA